jgi:hypothetical protein
MRMASFSNTLNANSIEVHGNLFMRDHASFAADVNLAFAKVAGTLDLATAFFSKTLNANGIDVRGPLFMNHHATFAGDVILTGATVGSDIEMDTSSFRKLDAGDVNVRASLLMDDHASFAGDVDLAGTTVGGSLFMRDHASFAGDVILRGATVGSNLEMDTSSFSKTLKAESLNVHDSLFMRDHASFHGEVSLLAAKVGRDLDMDTASFSKTLTADRINVGGTIFMDRASFAGDLDLVGAMVGGNLQMSTASFSELSASRLDVRGNLVMNDHASFAGDVDLIGAKVDGDLDMSTASFSRKLSAIGISVRHVLFMDGVSVAGDAILINAGVGWLDLRSATASSIDLSGLYGTTGSELRLMGMDWRCRETMTAAEKSGTSNANARDEPQNWPLGNPSWRTVQCGGKEGALPRLILRNTHIEALQDDRDSWPPMLDLEGLRYDRLGGVGGVGSADMRRRAAKEWVDWLARDRTFSPQPYNQLASVLMTSGRRETAETILFAGRERERHEIWSRSDVGFWRWLSHDFWSWIWLSFLSVVAGYGIGLYTFRVLWWVAGLTLLGTVLLSLSPYAKQRGLPWRFGASLHRLLPIVELDKDFKDFFDNPDEPGQPIKLLRWQKVFFAGIALAGWVLGFFLLAAMGGLIPK